jgi:hypothetical protein
MKTDRPVALLLILGTFLVLYQDPVAATPSPGCTTDTPRCTEHLPALRQVFHQSGPHFAGSEETGYIHLPLKEREEAKNRWTGYDKIQHLGFSFLSTLSSQYVLTQKLHWEHAYRPLIVSTGVTSAVGIGKEYYDKRNGGIFSLRDLAADGLGILLASGLILL